MLITFLTLPTHWQNWQKNEVITMLLQYKQYKHNNRDGSFIILNIIAQNHTEWNNILYVYHSMMLIYIHFTLLIPVLSVEIMKLPCLLSFKFALFV